MSTPVKLLGFAVVLAAVFALALGVGSAVGPVGPVAEPPQHTGSHTDGPTRGASHVSREDPR